ncbi:Uncharacterised protein [Peptoniphilus harei]|uniref:Aminoacyl-tRNA hydrolase n=1 Tax=Peptoniphilus harei TaxID=54005 RepID=A0A2X1Y279_9FIRM|nr:aminoacyl-tRNA hydrolase [Peptoniphilus harei]SPY49073.1 Uncharacterised protein [Peptoniphilus harei]
MCDEHNINTEMKTDKKDKQMINQIDGWNIEVKFNENGFSLENLVEEYIKENFLSIRG